MFPRIISEQLIHPFKFYQDHAIHQGVRYGNELYALVAEFNVHQRLLAYQHMSELASAGNLTIITVAPTRYRGWLCLSAPGYLQWLQDQKSLRPTIAMSLQNRVGEPGKLLSA